MKLDLSTVEDTTQLKYRVPVSTKMLLDMVHDQCRKHKLDFTGALDKGLKEVARALIDALRAKGVELEPEPKAAQTNGWDAEPKLTQS